MKSLSFFLRTTLLNLGLFLTVPSLFSQILTTVNDTVDLYPEIPVTVNLLANDTIPYGDSLAVFGGGASGSNQITITYSYLGFFTYLVEPMWGLDGTLTGQYMVLDFTSQQTSSARILFRIHDHSFDSIDINNVSAVFNAYGNHFFLSGAGSSRFFVPKGTGKSTVFNQTLWIGGKGNDSTLYLAAERYRQGAYGITAGNKPDFYAGPVMDSDYYSIYQDTLWNTVWKVSKAEIEYHKSYWNTTGYVPIRNIRTWPGNGNTDYGQTRMLAPFYDRNGDGNYDPLDGDYPSVRGDQALFFIFNDDRDTHKETGGNKMKVEIHGMAYAFDLPGDSSFKNTIFVNYKLYNRSQRTYYNTYLGLFTDFDIGYSSDDFTGCDVGRSSFFAYNGTPLDGNGQPNAYGAHPPAQALTILGGPYLDVSGRDRPRFDQTGHPLCNESANGTGFGDSIANNERYGMTGFMAYKNPGTQLQDPVIASDYYNSMKSVWADSTDLVYGGEGHASAGGYGPKCRFIFPGDSDTLNWGTGCRLPNGPLYWTPSTAGITPQDFHATASMGPFTFRPGDVQELDYAFIFARDYTGNDSLPSLSKLKSMIDSIRNSYDSGKLPGGNSFFAVNDHHSIPEFSVKVYPNPASSCLTVTFNRMIREQLHIRLVQANGVMVYSSEMMPLSKEIHIDIGRLNQGIYVLMIQGKDVTITRKVVVIH
jgi:hypothetical protein